METATKELNPEQVLRVREILTSSEGRMMTVGFIKRTNGEYREMNCRTGVKKWVKGVGLNYDPKAHDLLGVHVQNEADKKKDGAYRSVNLRTVIFVRVDGQEYWAKDNFAPTPYKEAS